MRRKELAKLFDPAQHRYSRAQPDPFAPGEDRLMPAPLALHTEIRERLLAGAILRTSELATNFCVDEDAVEKAIEYETGRIAGQCELLAMWRACPPLSLCHPGRSVLSREYMQSARRRKGESRPRRFDREAERWAARMVLDEGMTYEKAAEAIGSSVQVIKTAKAREEGRREALCYGTAY